MSFQNARQNLSIVQVAEHLGYAYNKAKGQIRPEYEHPNGDTIIITFPNDPSRQMYFNRDGGSDKGSVIDFIKNRLNHFNGISYQKEMDGVNQVLTQFKAIEQRPITHNFVNAPEKGVFDITQFDLKNVDKGTPQYKYLLSRGLSQKTLDKFKPHIALVKDNKTNFYNIGFPYKDDKNNTVGFEVRNQNFKGHARNSNKESGVWIANFATANGLTRNVFLFESAIDAMSFHQLYNNKFDFEHSAFISFGGAVTSGQIDTVLKTFPQAQLMSGFDNDFPGHVYDIAVEKKINPKFQVSFLKEGHAITVGHKSEKTVLKDTDFSLKKVADLIGQKPKLYVTKPTQGKDYNEMLGLLTDKVKKNEVGY